MKSRVAYFDQMKAVAINLVIMSRNYVAVMEEDSYYCHSVAGVVRCMDTYA